MEAETDKSKREADLAEQAQRGDKEACGALLLQYLPMMYGIAGGYLRHVPRLEADDIVNECFATLMRRKLRAFDRTKGSFCTWIHMHIRAVMSVIVRGPNSERKQKILKSAVFSQMRTQFDESTFGESIVDNWTPAAIQRTASIDQLCVRLEPRRATVLKMRADGFTLTEIGEAMGVTRERIRQLERDAIKELQSVYANCESVEDLPEIPNCRPVKYESKKE